MLEIIDYFIRSLELFSQIEKEALRHYYCSHMETISSPLPQKSMFTDGGHCIHYREREEEKRQRLMLKKNRLKNTEVMDRSGDRITYRAMEVGYKDIFLLENRKETLCSYLYSQPDICKQIEKNI